MTYRIDSSVYFDDEIASWRLEGVLSEDGKRICRHAVVMPDRINTEGSVNQLMEAEKMLRPAFNAWILAVLRHKDGAIG